MELALGFIIGRQGHSLMLMYEMQRMAEILQRKNKGLKKGLDCVPLSWIVLRHESVYNVPVS